MGRPMTIARKGWRVVLVVGVLSPFASAVGWLNAAPMPEREAAPPVQLGPAALAYVEAGAR